MSRSPDRVGDRRHKVMRYQLEKDGHGRGIVDQRYVWTVLHTADPASGLINLCTVVKAPLVDAIGVRVLSSDDSENATRFFESVRSTGLRMHSIAALCLNRRHRCGSLSQKRSEVQGRRL
jgi:hypothetical protein